MILTTVSIIIGFLLDLCFGDPYCIPHPVRLIGALISGLEKFYRKIFPKTAKGEFVAGVIMNICVLLVCTAIPLGILLLCYKIHPALGVAIESIMCYQILATKSLKTESMKVYDKCKNANLDEARTAVSMIVGRDTKDLSLSGVIKAAVETVAENTSDGIVAPMLFMMIGGAPLGFFYKAVNTMDSMVGYKNEQYMNFGRFSAKLDDVMNFLPSRIAGFLMIVAAKFSNLDAKNALMIFKRDRFNHASPNSAQTESVCAGALNIMLAGDAYYFGKLHHKKTIGDANREINCEDIVHANKLLYVTASLTLVMTVVARILVIALLHLCNLRGML